MRSNAACKNRAPCDMSPPRVTRGGLKILIRLETADPRTSPCLIQHFNHYWVAVAGLGKNIIEDSLTGLPLIRSISVASAGPER